MSNNRKATISRDLVTKHFRIGTVKTQLKFSKNYMVKTATIVDFYITFRHAIRHAIKPFPARYPAHDPAHIIIVIILQLISFIILQFNIVKNIF